MGVGRVVGSEAWDFGSPRVDRVHLIIIGRVHVIVIRWEGRRTWGRGHRDALHPLGVSPLRSVNRNGRYRSCLAVRSLITLRGEAILFDLGAV